MKFEPRRANVTYSFGYFELHTPKLENAKSFYGELFNWRFKDLDIPGTRYALSEGNGLQGALMEDELPFWLNYVTVDNVEQAGQKAQRLGGKVLRTRTEVPGEGAFVVIADPSGARLALWEQAKK
jgi:uncharacterized protein